MHRRTAPAPRTRRMRSAQDREAQGHWQNLNSDVREDPNNTSETRACLAHLYWKGAPLGHLLYRLPRSACPIPVLPSIG